MMILVMMRIPVSIKSDEGLEEEGAMTSTGLLVSACLFKLVIFKLILRMNVLSIPSEIALK